MFAWLRRLFGNELSLNRVHDLFTVKEGNEQIQLRIDSAPRLLVTKIRNANEHITGANRQEATDEDRVNAARMFAEAMFGEDQTDRLAELYKGDYSCVMAISGLYFEKRLCKKIVKAQKKLK